MEKVCFFFVINRTQSCHVKNKTPFELWSSKIPNVCNMCVFGCIAYARIPDSLRTKLDNKGVKCVFVGYTENGQRLWNLKEEKLIHSRDVVFDENNFMNKKENYLRRNRENEGEEIYDMQKIKLKMEMKKYKVKLDMKKKIIKRIMKSCLVEVHKMTDHKE